METKDQKFYYIDGKLKAEIDVYYTNEMSDAPPISECRHAVLTVKNSSVGYVVYDRLLCRVVNGVFSSVDDSRFAHFAGQLARLKID